MSNCIASLTAAPWTLPLKAPFRIAARTAYEAQNVLVSVSDDGGTLGFGGAAPVGYVTGESVQSVVSLIASVSGQFYGMDPSRIGPLLDRAASLLPEAPSARAAIEMALLDLWGRRHRINLWHYFGARKETLTTDLTIPIVEPAEAAKLARTAASQGFTHFKIKVGRPEGQADDLARIAAVSSAAPQAGIRVDANQGFTPEAAIRFASELVQITPNIELIEQPVFKEDITGLRYVRERASVPVYADESAQTPKGVRRLIREEAVDGVNIKLMKAGILGALEIISICRASGIKLMIGCMLESRLSLTAAAYIAAGTGAFGVIDLDAHCLLAPDPERRGGFADRGPDLTIDSSGYGWGVQGLASTTADS